MSPGVQNLVKYIMVFILRVLFMEYDYKKIGYNINVLQQTAYNHSWQLCFPLDL